MSRADTQLKFRIPPALKPMLERAASANKRSLNMEIIARLEQSFEVPGLTEAKSKAAASRLLRLTSHGDPLEERIAALEQRVKKLEQR